MLRHKTVVAVLITISILVMTASSAFAGPLGYTTTNDLNREKGLPHVNCVDGGPGWVELEFVVPTKFAAVFEVRVDNAPPGDVEHDGAKYYSYIPEETYYEPYIVIGVGSEPRVHTQRFDAKGLVQVRHAAGAENEWYFDWVDFEVEPKPGIPSKKTTVYAPFMYSSHFYELLHIHQDFWKAVKLWWQEKELYGW